MHSTTDKKHLRAFLRHRRSALFLQERIYAAQAVYNKIMTLNPFWVSQNIAFYKAHDAEVSIDNVLKKAQTIQKNCYLPVLRSCQRQLDFYSYHLENPLIKNRFGIEEPDTSQEKLISIANLNLIFLPLVAFDKRGNRLGRGAGYYDRALAPLKDRALKKPPVLVGIAYNFQKINKIRIEKWDVPLNFVITEKKFINFRMP
ncbi:5-formyltetrahydrofolate cyclo-ligase [Coxiella-like endosymbiont]|uniref:5-formyltetrahydrofolate cyclo-ligase n=1 Tax=Coxiella-like endosymbiont TaxID=1592897 RepID=UPI00272B6E07|nr:5-formyltetrahydrofolate cyclo-ligase [Coxiella-like endosymbiont]